MRIANPMSLYFAVTEGDPLGLLPALDTGIERLKQYPDSMYFSSLSWRIETPPRIKIPAWLVFLLLGITLVAIFIIVMNISLRHLVAKEGG